MRNLVTGASGHIGSALIRKLIFRGEDVVALTLPGESLESFKGFDVDIEYGDVTDRNGLSEAFKRIIEKGPIDRAYHLAGIVSIGSGKRRLINKVNVEGTKNVADMCSLYPVGRLIYASSVHAIKEGKRGEIITETNEFDPMEIRGIYGKSKAMATAYVLECTKKGLNAVVVHPSGVVGPYEFKRSNFGQMVVDFCNRRLIAYVDGAYNFVDVRDVAEGMILAAERGVSGECYILSGERMTVREMLTILSGESKVAFPKIKMPYAFAKFTAPLAELYYKILGQPPLYTSYSVATLRSNCNISCEKAVKELGYLPRPVAASLRDCVNWFRGINVIKK